MPRLHTLYVILAVSIVLAIAQQFAFAYYLYWRFWWFDIVMHFGGGFISSLSARASGLRSARWTIGVALVVGIVWELYELTIGISLTERNYFFDTAKDLITDGIGGMAAYGIIRWWDRLYQSPLPEALGVSPDQTSSSH